MAVKSSGQLSITTDIVGEFGGSAPHAISEYKRGGSLVPDGPSANADIPTTNENIQWSDFYGAVNETDLSQALTPVTINGESTAKQITVSDYISSGGILTIPSSLWVWTDSTSIAALIIDIPCTIKNSGKIIGQGGNGGNGRTAGTDGGPAIKINSGVTGVTIINNSGAYIAGGGGGGSGYESGGGSSGGGGGGAGGGSGGEPTTTAGSGGGGAGGIINAAGADGADRVGTISGNTRIVTGGGGGGAGGAGGVQVYDYFGSEGGGGGRILPGVGGAGSQYTNSTGTTVYYTGPAGASGGDAGANASSSGGAGGGWGAAGGSGYAGAGGAGGAAILDSGVTYTLTDNGTIYGAT